MPIREYEDDGDLEIFCEYHVGDVEYGNLLVPLDTSKVGQGGERAIRVVFMDNPIRDANTIQLVTMRLFNALVSELESKGYSYQRNSGGTLEVDRTHADEDGGVHRSFTVYAPAACANDMASIKQDIVDAMFSADQKIEHGEDRNFRRET